MMSDEEFEHHEEIRRRARAAEDESGAMRPYEVLEVPADAKQTTIRKAYRKETYL
jgi:DnaJ-domain-containing protein 1